MVRHGNIQAGDEGTDEFESTRLSSLLKAQSGTAILAPSRARSAEIGIYLGNSLQYCTSVQQDFPSSNLLLQIN